MLMWNFNSYEDIDAQTWASWGVDYLKYDNCFNEGQSGTANISYERYAKMSTALNNTGRPILYSMCNWGQDHPWDWAMTIANSYRSTGDVFDTFDRPDVRCPCEVRAGELEADTGVSQYANHGDLTYWKKKAPIASILASIVVS